MTKKTKRFVPNVDAIKARLEANKQKSQRKQTSINEHPLVRVDVEGEHLFRATHYPHSEDPAAEPFPTRYYHFGVPGSGPLYCPKLNAGQDCDLCEFVWTQMKANKGNKEEVKKWGDKLPKGRVWIPGKLRGREDEGVKFFSFTTYEREMSKHHKKLFSWFEKRSTASFLSPDDDGLDMILTYEKYDEKKAAMFRSKFGFDGMELERDASAFGDDYDDFLDSIPDIDNNDIDILKSYGAKTSEDLRAALEKWTDRLGKEAPVAKVAEADTSALLDESAPTATATKPANKKGPLAERLAKAGIKVKE